jgi:hypothetical protein
MGDKYLKTITMDDLKCRPDIQVIYNRNILYLPRAGTKKEAGAPFTICIPYLWQHGVDVCRPIEEFTSWATWAAPDNHIITEADLAPLNDKKNVGLWYFVRSMGWYSDPISVPINTQVDLILDGNYIGTFRDEIFCKYPFGLQLLGKKLGDSYASGLPKTADFINDSGEWYLDFESP